MKTTCAGAIRGHWDEHNQRLIPWIDDNIGELDAAHRLFMAVCEAVIKPREFEYAKWKGNGRPPASRLKIFKAFLLKAVLNVKDTKELVRMLRAEPLSRRLCGWDSPGLVPSESRFSRVFGEAQQVPGRTVDGFQGQIREHRPSDGPLDSAPDINGIPLEEAFSSSPLPPPSIVHIGLPAICGLQQAADRFSEQWRNTNSSPFQDPDTCPDIYVSYLESFLFGRAYGTI